MDEKQKEEIAVMDIGSLPVNQEPSEEEPDKETEAQTQDQGTGTPEPSEEETKVSYSRFKNIHTRYRDAEKRAAELEAQLAELESQRAVPSFEREAPKTEGRKWETWKKFYGDSDQSKELFRDWMNEFAPPDETYIQQIAVQAYEAQARNEERRVAGNEQYIDDQLEDLSVSLGRDLTDEEQTEVLEIMDEFSATDEDGRIISLYPAEKAWEIYEIQHNVGTSTRIQNRNKVAALTSTGTKGEVSASGKGQENKDFDPRWEAFDASLQRRK